MMMAIPKDKLNGKGRFLGAFATLAIVSILLLAVPAFAQITPDVTAMSSWKSTDGTTISADASVLSIPYTITNGIVQSYVEVLPGDTTGRVRIRNATGPILTTYANQDTEIGDCTSPTGAIITDRNSKVLVMMCSASGRMVAITFADQTIQIAATTYEGVEFTASTAIKAPPIVFSKLRNDEYDVVIASFSMNRQFCVGGISTRSQNLEFATCYSKEVNDFYLSVPPRPPSEGYVYLVVEFTESSSTLKLSGYRMDTFTATDSNFQNAAWNASVDLAQIASPIVRSNINDETGSSPVVAYVQAGSTDNPIKITAMILNVNTGTPVSQGRIETSAPLVDSSDALEAWLVSISSTQTLVVQTKSGAAAIPMSSLANPVTATWTVAGAMIGGLTFTPLRSLTANPTEPQRFQNAPSYNNYNLYHMITATGMVVGMSGEDQHLSVYSFSSMSSSSANISLDVLQNCVPTGDRIIALTTYSSNSAYFGCQAGGAYGLVDLTANTVLYTMLFPTITSSPLKMPIGELTLGNGFSLSSTLSRSGVLVATLPQVLVPTNADSGIAPAAVYYKGSVYVVAASGTNYTFSKYSVSTSPNGLSAWTADYTSNRFGSSERVTQQQVFMTLYGPNKALAAVLVSASEVYTVTISSGAISGPLSLAVDGASTNDAQVTSLRADAYDTVSATNYVAYGTTTVSTFKVTSLTAISVSRGMTGETGTIAYSTKDYGLLYNPTAKTIRVYADVFDDSVRNVNTFTNVGVYALGTNVLVQMQGTNLACLGIRTSGQAWTYAMPSNFGGTAIMIKYYNNSIYVVDKTSFFQFDPAYYEPGNTQNRMLVQRPFTTDTTAGDIIAANVDMGIVVGVTASTMFVYDAYTWQQQFNGGIKLRTTLATTSTISILMNSASTAGESTTAGTGPYIIEVRSDTAAAGNTPASRTSTLYRADTGAMITGVDGPMSTFTGATITSSAYFALQASSSSTSVTAFRSLNLPAVSRTTQSTRTVLPKTDVTVPSEVTVAPTPAPVPRGDVNMAGSPPTDFFVRGSGALINPSLSTAVLGVVVPDAGRYTYTLKCVNVATPLGTPVWTKTLTTSSTANVGDNIQFMDFSSSIFIVFTQSGFQFYNWADGSTTGSVFSLSGRTASIPSYISQPDSDLFIFLNTLQVTAVKPSTSAQSWQATVGSCDAIKLVNGNIICDGPSMAVVSSAGTLVFSRSVAGVLTQVGSQYVSVRRLTDGSYAAVSMSATGEDTTTVALSQITTAAGNPVAAVSGWVSGSILVAFDTVVAQIENPTSASTVSITSWDMRGQNPQRNALVFITTGGNLMIGTGNSTMFIDSTGSLYSNISMRRRYTVEASEAQTLSFVTISTSKIAIRWNGHVTLVNITASTATAVFSYGSGRTRALSLGYASSKLYFNDGPGAGIARIDTIYWGSNLNYGVATESGGSVFVLGVDNSNITEGVNLGSTSINGAMSQNNVNGEVSISASSLATTYGAFYGSRTISAMSRTSSSGFVYPLSSTCSATQTFMGYTADPRSTGNTLVWYSGTNNDCIYSFTNTGSLPQYLSTFRSKYVTALLVPYAGTYGMLTSTTLIAYDASQAIIDRVTLTNAVYMSTVTSSAYTTGGIFVVIDQPSTTTYRASVYQTNNVVKAWETTIPATSTAPTTYYNNSLFMSTQSGVIRLTMEELSYPCPDRIMFTITRAANSLTDYHSQPVINTYYGVGYATTRRVFYCFSANTGAIMWERADLDAVKDVLVINNGYVIVVSSYVYGAVFLNAFTGATLLTIPTQANTFSSLYLASDGKTLTVANMMTTTINLDLYQSYFSGVTPTWSTVPATDGFRPYGYTATIEPPSCTALPDGTPGADLYFRTPVPWVSASRYGYVSPTTVGFFQRNADTYGTAVVLKGTQVYAGRTIKGSYQKILSLTLNSSTCTYAFFAGNGDASAFSRDPNYIGVTCGSDTTFYRATAGTLAGTATGVNVQPRFVSTSASNDRTYFINGENTLDSMLFSTFARPSGVRPGVSCPDANPQFFLSESRTRGVLYCPSVGIMGVALNTMRQNGNTLRSRSGGTNFANVDVDDANNIGVACRIGTSGSRRIVEAFAFPIGSMASTNLFTTEVAATAVSCGIGHSSTGAYVVVAYTNGVRVWASNALSADPTITEYTGSPCGVTSNSVVFFSNGALSSIPYTGGTVSPLESNLGNSMPRCLPIRDRSTQHASEVMVAVGSGYIMSANTSATKPQLWFGNDGSVVVPNSARYATSYPYVYTQDDSGYLIGLAAMNVSYAVYNALASIRLTVALIDNRPYVYIAQATSLACLNPDGRILWNYVIASNGDATIPFAPILVDNSDYMIASGGRQSLAYVNRLTGKLLSSTTFPTRCARTGDFTSANVFTNATTAYIQMFGWSCVHILDLTITTSGDGTPRIPNVQLLEYTGPGGNQALIEGYPKLARVQYRDLLVLAYQTPSTTGNYTFAVYRVSTLLWSASIRVSPNTISTYGYFLYTASGSTLNVYDLLTGRYVWGYIFSDAVMAPVMGYNPYLFVFTLSQVHQLYCQLNTPTNARRLTNTSLPVAAPSAPTTFLPPTVTKYGLFLYSNNYFTAAFVIAKGNITRNWDSDRIITVATPFLEASKSVFLVTTDVGAGVLDLSTGFVSTFSNLAPSFTDLQGSDHNGFTCTFASYLGACRTLTDDLLTPTFSLREQPIPDEPTEITPADWVPIYPDSTYDLLSPSPECAALLELYYPQFVSCVNTQIANVFPNGRNSVLTCPQNVFGISTCYDRFFAPINTGSCNDVVMSLKNFIYAQVNVMNSPLGMCNLTEAAKRCNSTDDAVLADTCNAVSYGRVFGSLNYGLSSKYDLGYALSPFTFPGAPPPKVNIGAIVGGVVGGVVFVAVVAVIAFFVLRKQHRERDARFFEDPIGDEENLQKGQRLDEPMLSARQSEKSSEMETAVKSMKSQKMETDTEDSISLSHGQHQDGASDNKSPANPLREEYASETSTVRSAASKATLRGRGPVVNISDDDL